MLDLLHLPKDKVKVVYGDYDTKYHTSEVDYVLYIGNTIDINDPIYPVKDIFDDSCVVWCRTPHIFDSDVSYTPTLSINTEEHVHFSAYVKYKTIIRDLNSMWMNGLGYFSYRKHDDYNIPISSSRALQMVRNAWKKRNMNILGNMFYGIIKDIKYLPIYLQLFTQQMKDSNTKHIDVRVKLGGVFDIHNERKVNVDIITEWNIISRLNNVSFIIQYNRNSPPNRIKEYFNNIEKTINSDRIIAYDLTGLEHKEFSPFPWMKYTKKPWRLHIGEGMTQTHRNNMDSYSKMDNTTHNIGHGIANITLDKKYEITPIGYIWNNTLSIEQLKLLIQELYRKNIQFSVSSDNCNKYGDNDIWENLKFLRQLGISKDDIKRLL